MRYTFLPTRILWCQILQGQRSPCISEDTGEDIEQSMISSTTNPPTVQNTPMMAHTNKVPRFHHCWIMRALTSKRIIILHPPIPSCTHHIYRLGSTDLGGFPHCAGHRGSEIEPRNKPAPGPSKYISNHWIIGRLGRWGWSPANNLFWVGSERLDGCIVQTTLHRGRTATSECIMQYIWSKHKLFRTIMALSWTPQSQTSWLLRPVWTRTATTQEQKGHESSATEV
jgi:hypothetical protein